MVLRLELKGSWLVFLLVSSRRRRILEFTKLRSKLAYRGSNLSTPNHEISQILTFESPRVVKHNLARVYRVRLDIFFP